jgi:hypothetical protein
MGVPLKYLRTKSLINPIGYEWRTFLGRPQFGERYLPRFPVEIDPVGTIVVDRHRQPVAALLKGRQRLRGVALFREIVTTGCGKEWEKGKNKKFHFNANNTDIADIY